MKEGEKNRLTTAVASLPAYQRVFREVDKFSGKKAIDATQKLEQKKEEPQRGIDSSDRLADRAPWAGPGQRQPGPSKHHLPYGPKTYLRLLPTGLREALYHGNISLLGT